MKAIVFIVWFAIGVVPGWFGIKYLGEARSYVERSVETTATVFDFRFENAGRADHNDNNDFRMWAEFEYVDGSVINAPTNVWSGNDRERIGESIVILYDPQRVSPVRVKSFFSLYMLPAVLLGLAILIWLFGFRRAFGRR